MKQIRSIRFRSILSRSAGRLSAVVVCASLASGCGMSSLTSGIGGGLFGSKQKQTTQGPVNEAQLLSAAKADSNDVGGIGGEVAHGCPRFAVWPRDHYVTVYEPGRVGDGLAVMHRGEITKTARECNIEPGRVTVKYGFSGRVLLGPRGKAGMVTLPLDVFVMDSKREKIAKDVTKVDVPLTLEKPIGYFSAVKTITFNIPEGTRPGEYEAYVAFNRSVPGAE